MSLHLTLARPARLKYVMDEVLEVMLLLVLDHYGDGSCRGGGGGGGMGCCVGGSGVGGGLWIEMNLLGEKEGCVVGGRSFAGE